METIDWRKFRVYPKEEDRVPIYLPTVAFKNVMKWAKNNNISVSNCADIRLKPFKRPEKLEEV